MVSNELLREARDKATATTVASPRVGGEIRKNKLNERECINVHSKNVKVKKAFRKVRF